MTQNPYDPAQTGGHEAMPPAYPAPPLAHWGQRVGAFLLDYVLYMVAAAPLWIGYAMMAASTTTTTRPDGTISTDMDVSGASIGLIVVGSVTALAFFIWNYCFKQGRTGYTIGKGILGIKLIKATTGQPMGAGMAFVRQLAHIVDSIPCYLGYLWPLWDSKRQTFADKIMSTVVVVEPKR